jgi:hypothetical protein
MKLLSYCFVCVLIAFVFYAVISFVRFAFVHIKAYVIRRKSSSSAQKDNKND